MNIQKILIPLLGTFFSLPKEQTNIATFRTEHILVDIHSPRQFSNLVLLAVSTDGFHLDKKKIDPQRKMLRESESLQI